MEYIIGVDAGATKTRAVALDTQGKPIVESIAGPGNYTLDFEQALDSLRKSIDGCIRQMADEMPLYIGVGGAGLVKAVDKANVEQYLATLYTCGAKAIDDGELALYAAHQGDDGILVVAGTGSIVYGKQGDQTLRNGGWGHLIDDWGSGYHISIETIKDMTADVDAGHVHRPLAHQVMTAIEADEFRDVISYIYRHDKPAIAKMAKIVIHAADAGDGDALNILNRCAEKLVGLTCRLTQRLELKKPSVALSGSLITKCAVYRQMFMDHYQAMYPLSTFTYDSIDPATGAYYLYQLHVRDNSVSEEVQ